MRQATMILNRQVIRLCKGLIKAWEQWVDDVESEAINANFRSNPKISDSDHDGAQKDDHERTPKR